MKNDYSWSMINSNKNDFLMHGTAHYSANWNKAKQDAYNKEYYQKHKDKWGVEGGYSEDDKQVKYSGNIGESGKGYKEFMKGHGGDDNKNYDANDVDWMGKGGNFFKAKAKDGTRAIVNEDTVVASGEDIGDLDDDDMKVINDYLTEIYAQAGDHVKNKKLKEGSKEYAQFYKDFNNKVNEQVKGIIAKEKQNKAKKHGVS